MYHRSCSCSDERSLFDLRLRKKRRYPQSDRFGREAWEFAAAFCDIRAEPDHRVREPCGAARPGIGAAATAVPLTFDGHSTLVFTTFRSSRSQVRARRPGRRATYEASTSDWTTFVTAHLVTSRPAHAASAQCILRPVRLLIVGNAVMPSRFRKAHVAGDSLQSRGGAPCGPRTECRLFGATAGDHEFIDPATTSVTSDLGSGCGNCGLGAVVRSVEVIRQVTRGRRALVPEIIGGAVPLDCRMASTRDLEYRKQVQEPLSNMKVAQLKLTGSIADAALFGVAANDALRHALSSSSSHRPRRSDARHLERPVHRRTRYPSRVVGIAEDPVRQHRRPSEASPGNCQGEDGSTGTRSRRFADGGGNERRALACRSDGAYRRRAAPRGGREAVRRTGGRAEGRPRVPRRGLDSMLISICSQGPLHHLARSAAKHWTLAQDLERRGRGEQPTSSDLQNTSILIKWHVFPVQTSPLLGILSEHPYISDGQICRTSQLFTLYRRSGRTRTFSLF